MSEKTHADMVEAHVGAGARDAESAIRSIADAIEAAADGDVVDVGRRLALAPAYLRRADFHTRCAVAHAGVVAANGGTP